MKPEYLNFPLPEGIESVDEALDYLKDFAGEQIQSVRSKHGFKYFKPIGFTCDLEHNQAIITLKLLYSEQHAARKS